MIDKSFRTFKYVRAHGSGMCVTISAEERECLDLNFGDVVEVTICVTSMDNDNTRKGDE